MLLRSPLLLALAALAGQAAGASIQFGPAQASLLVNSGLRKPFPGGPRGPESIAIADVDGDGKADVITAGPGGVAVMRGRGDGTFETATIIAVLDAVAVTVIGDINRDGIPDLAVSDSTGSASILLSQPGGAYVTGPSGSFGAVPWLEAGLIDGDAIPDVVAVAPSQFVIFPDGGSPNPFPTMGSPTMVRLAATNPGAPADWFIALAGGVLAFRDGGGVPSPFGQPIDNASQISAIAVGRIFNGGDVVAVRSGAIDVIQNIGGLFGGMQSTPLPSFPNPTAIDVADFDGDGLGDVVVVDPSTQLVQVLQNTGVNLDGSQGPMSTNTSDPLFVRAADVNGDGHPDIVIADPSLNQVVVRLFLQSNPIITQPDSLAILEDTSGSVNALANDSGGSGPLIVIGCGPGTHGKASPGPDPQSVTYMPFPGYFGPDDFTYTVSDGSQTATGAVHVNVNAPPTNTALPAISVKTPKPLVLQTSNGSWSDPDDAVTTFVYQWQRASSPVAQPSDIGGATGATYATTSADTGKLLRVKVTASDSGDPVGSAQAISEWFSATPPANDDANKAIVIVGTFGTTSGSNIAATKQVGEPNHAGNAAGHSVWWTWKSPMKQGGTLTLNTFGSGFNTVLAAYTGSKVNALTLKGQNDDSGGPQSQVSFAVVPNTTYLIAVDGSASVTQPTTGAITLSWSFTSP